MNCFHNFSYFYANLILKLNAVHVGSVTEVGVRFTRRLCVKTWLILFTLVTYVLRDTKQLYLGTFLGT